MGIYESNNSAWSEARKVIKDLLIVGLVILFMVAFLRGAVEMLCEPGPVAYDRGE